MELFGRESESSTPLLTAGNTMLPGGSVISPQALSKCVSVCSPASISVRTSRMFRMVNFFFSQAMIIVNVIWDTKGLLAKDIRTLFK